MSSKNTANSFVIEVGTVDQDPNLFYKKGFMAELKKYPWLTVSGQNPPPVGRGVEYASHGNLITVGTADKHDVEWIERPNYARERGLTPVLNLVKDWNTITAKLKTYADSKMGYTTEAGAKVTFHPNYVKVGFKAYPYTDAQLVFTNADIINMYFGLKR
jgi:hypothetical protein